MSTIATVSKTLKFTETEQDLILSMFLKSGQNTSGAVMHAVTAAAQTVANPDRAAELESAGVPAMMAAHRFARVAA